MIACCGGVLFIWLPWIDYLYRWTRDSSAADQEPEHWLVVHHDLEVLFRSRRLGDTTLPQLTLQLVINLTCQSALNYDFVCYHLLEEHSDFLVCVVWFFGPFCLRLIHFCHAGRRDGISWRACVEALSGAERVLVWYVHLGMHELQDQLHSFVPSEVSRSMTMGGQLRTD